MQRNFIPAVISPGQTLSTLANGQDNMRFAGVFVGTNFSGSYLNFRCLDNNSGQYIVSDGAGASYSRSCRSNDYVSVPKDIGVGLSKVLFAANTSQVTNACSLLAVFVDI